MRTKKNVIALFTLMITALSATAAFAQERVISKADLPQPAKTFLDSNFKEQKVIQVVKDTEYLVKTTYEVLLDNAMELEFDGKGNWKEIDGNHNPIPESLVPEKIGQYVQQNFPMQTINKIEKSSVKYEVELANDLDLEFALNGEFLRIDD
ncbi:PepSY-like domain-containing protein [Sinomicrobium oceani]|uniref:PepSY-like domain-containing protein n=1 Tax=Sinomicrobium oceani TaxID=1150368 RepID=UPI00227AA419|nr:PepSY-like domain-containing protein [Sinomicrobium oceani]